VRAIGTLQRHGTAHDTVKKKTHTHIVETTCRYCDLCSEVDKKSVNCVYEVMVYAYVTLAICCDVPPSSSLKNCNCNNVVVLLDGIVALKHLHATLCLNLSYIKCDHNAHTSNITQSVYGFLSCLLVIVFCLR
jgi:hypothetical protein